MSDTYSTPPPPPPGGPPAGGSPEGGPPGYGSPAPSGGGLAWETSKDPGSLLATAKRFITAPGDAYRATPEKGDYLSPLLFGIVMITISAIVAAFWKLIIPGPETMLSEIDGMPPEIAQAFAGSGSVMDIVLTLIFVPIIGVIVLFVWSGIVHLTLSLLGGLRDSTAGFEGTFRSLSYGQVAQLAQAIPFVGGLLSMVWSIALQMIGLSTIHRTSQGKAVAAVLIPIFVCCCLVIGGVMAFGAAIAAAVGAAGAGG